MIIQGGNYQRPEGFKNERADCTVRSLSLSANLPYGLVHKAFHEAGRKNRRGIRGKKVIQVIAKRLGIKATQVKRSGTLKSFVEKYPQGRYWCLRRGHAFSVIDGVIHDEFKEGVHIRGAWRIEKEGI